MSACRVGLGWDIHRLAAGRPLMVGGVRIPAEFGAEGHSDADALCHAVTDALLGAAALGDIGQHFPDSDPRWAGASSLLLLGHALELVCRRGYRLLSVDATVVLEQPKLNEYRERIRESLARTLELPLERISVKFKTAEKLGPVGEGRAVEAQAVVTLLSDQPAT